MTGQSDLIQDEIAGLLYEALAEPVGLVLNLSNFDQGRQMIYKVRRGLADPALMVLQLKEATGALRAEGNLLIVKAEVLDLPPEATPSAKPSAKPLPGNGLSIDDFLKESP